MLSLMFKQKILKNHIHVPYSSLGIFFQYNVYKVYMKMGILEKSKFFFFIFLILKLAIFFFFFFPTLMRHFSFKNISLLTPPPKKTSNWLIE